MYERKIAMMSFSFGLCRWPLGNGGSTEPCNISPHRSCLNCQQIEMMSEADLSPPITSQSWAVDFPPIVASQPWHPKPELFLNQCFPHWYLCLWIPFTTLAFADMFTPIMSKHGCVLPNTTAWNQSHCFHSFPLNVCLFPVFHLH